VTCENDVKENRLLKLDPALLKTLLIDRTTGRNIIWATNNYEYLGENYAFDKHIEVELITGENGEVIKPRVEKSKNQQKERTKNRAEVFTPSWVCKAQNDLWERIGNFQDWREFVECTCLEITCGEAPYICSRYDATTGKKMKIDQRVGFLDRKLQKVAQNCKTEKEWLKWSKIAYQNSYGYEWQGDNVLLARENLLCTFCDYYKRQFKKKPNIELQKEFAQIISWNIWQMDGLKFVVPNSDKLAKIMDWKENEPVVFKSVYKETKDRVKTKAVEEEIYSNFGIDR
jgi:hypothetical protein